MNPSVELLFSNADKLKYRSTQIIPGIDWSVDLYRDDGHGGVNSVSKRAFVFRPTSKNSISIVLTCMNETLNLKVDYQAALLSSTAVDLYQKQESAFNGSCPEVIYGVKSPDEYLSEATKNFYVLYGDSKNRQLYYINADHDRAEKVTVNPREPNPDDTFAQLSKIIDDKESPYWVLSRLIGDQQRYKENLTILLKSDRYFPSIETVNYSKCYLKMKEAFEMVATLLNLPAPLKQAFNAKVDELRTGFLEKQTVTRAPLSFSTFPGASFPTPPVPRPRAKL